MNDFRILARKELGVALVSKFNSRYQACGAKWLVSDDTADNNANFDKAPA
jgi:hypothetical protein